MSSSTSSTQMSGRTVGISGGGVCSSNSMVDVGKLRGTDCREVNGGDVGDHKGFGSRVRTAALTNFFVHDVNRPYDGRESPCCSTTESESASVPYLPLSTLRSPHATAFSMAEVSNQTVDFSFPSAQFFSVSFR